MSVVEDAKLLAELDAEIRKNDCAFENPISGAVLGALFPGTDKLLPLAKKDTDRKNDLLRRAKNRLEELMMEVSE